MREREWVLPTHLREKWSLRRFADVFDGIGVVPPDHVETENPLDAEDVVSSNSKVHKEKTDKRRGGKRVLLATVDSDSTVVYYIVHDGIVKPRQN